MPWFSTGKILEFPDQWRRVVSADDPANQLPGFDGVLGWIELSLDPF